MTDSLYHRQLEKIKLESMSTTDLVDMLRERDKRIEELEAQIELMKCCENCKYFDSDEPKYCHKGVYNCAYACGKWELNN